MGVSIGKSLVMLFLFGTASLALCYITSKKKQPLTRIESINDVLTFAELQSDTALAQPNPRSTLHPGTERILYYLGQSQRTLDICMDMITSLDIVCKLVDCHRRGVTVTMIVDRETAYAPASAVKLLKKQGITVHSAAVDANFRNFCLVDAFDNDSDDGIPFVIFGSITWTKEMLAGDNNQIVFVSSRDSFLNVFKEAYQRILTAAM